MEDSKKFLIIGSVAMFKGLNDLGNTKPIKRHSSRDIDYVVENPEEYDNSFKSIEYHPNPVLLKWYPEEKYIPLDGLLTLKLSHMFWDINWNKHMWDIQILIEEGIKPNMKLFSELYEFWESYHKKVHRSELTQSKEDFFSNAVNSSVDQHDYIHILINPVPMYTKLLKDNCEVELDESKWDALSESEKLEVVREETYVMAWERYKKKDYRAAYTEQLKDNIIKHFPKYIALFAIYNYKTLHMPKFNYRNVINKNLSK